LILIMRCVRHPRAIRRAPGRLGRATHARLLLALAVAFSMAAAAPGLARADTGAGARTDTFLPVADARVEEAHPDTAFGSLARLGSDGDAGLRVESVLKFSLGGLSGQIESARLRLFVVSDGTSDGPAVYPTGNAWTEAGVTWRSRPAATGEPVADLGAAAAGTWVELDVTRLVKGEGTVSMILKQAGLDGVVFYAREGAFKPQLLVTSSDPVVMAAGDIACRPGSVVTATRCRQGPVSDLFVQAPGPTRVLALGDEQYDDGAYADFLGAGAYDATWGRVKPITRPVPGNHEYHVAGGAGYFDYFNGVGAASGVAGERGKGYYSFDLGTWHLIALNSEIATTAGSQQGLWLKSDIAATRQPCLLAYWHEPRFSSGPHGAATWVTPLWTALYGARADVVLNGHDHDYERFAPQTPTGALDAKGIREFVVGTGGGDHYPAVTRQPNSEVYDATTFGALELTLRRGGYDWRFVPEAGGTFTEQGSGRCNDDRPAASLSVTPPAGGAPLAVSADASASKDADRTPIAGYEFDFGDGSPTVGPQPGAVATHRYEKPGTYAVTVTVSDTAGQARTATATVVARGDLVGNGDFEAGTSGWNAQPFGRAALDLVAGGHTGEKAARLSNAGLTADSCTLNDAPNWVGTTSPGTYTASMWVRGETGGASLKLRLAEWSGTTPIGSARATVTLSTDWQPVTVAYTPAAPGRSTLDLNAYVLDAPPGTCFRADDAAIRLAVG
jgi:hypothetical protein